MTIRTVPKWKIVIDRPDQAPMEFAMSEFHMANILSALAKMDFGAVTKVTVTLDSR